MTVYMANIEIIIASGNKNKLREYKELFKNLPIKVTSIVEEGLELDVEETGSTFEENSLIKAKEAWELGKTWTLADDSGLCIDALDGAPGIHSARYAETPQARINRVLKEMEGVEDRSARFKCCMTLLEPSGEIAFSYTGVCEGSIIREQRGVNGFGYDPIFLVDNMGKTMAELSEQDKNRVSHRGKALEAVLNYLRNYK